MSDPSNTRFVPALQIAYLDPGTYLVIQGAALLDELSYTWIEVVTQGGWTDVVLWPLKGYGRSSASDKSAPWRYRVVVAGSKLEAQCRAWEMQKALTGRGQTMTEADIEMLREMLE